MTIDTNTIVTAGFGTVLTGLSAWMLYTIHEMAKKQSADEAGTAEREKAQDAQIKENRSRIIDIEEDVGELKLDVATIKAAGKQRS